MFFKNKYCKQCEYYKDDCMVDLFFGLDICKSIINQTKQEKKEEFGYFTFGLLFFFIVYTVFFIIIYKIFNLLEVVVI